MLTSGSALTWRLTSEILSFLHEIGVEMGAVQIHIRLRTIHGREGAEGVQLLRDD